jgi:hypothetical protein
LARKWNVECDAANVSELVELLAADRMVVDDLDDLVAPVASAR